MPRTNSTVKIVDGKVVFSEEVLSYFESIRNEENSVWIDKYFECLSDESNLVATKYNLHHIRPCCTFKDEEHKNRRKTQPLGDAFKGNIIKISVYNHLLAHYCLWKIYDDWDSRHAIQRMCGQKKYIGDLTEDELKEIAKLQEECAKENQTKEERDKYLKEYEENRKEKRKIYTKEYDKRNKDKIAEYDKNRYEKNKEKMLKRQKELRKNRKDKIAEYDKKRNSRMCYDPKENDFCTYSALQARKKRHVEKYKDVIIQDCITNLDSINA